MRLSVIAASALISLAPALAQTTGSINVSGAHARVTPASPSFDIFLQRLWPQAQARGISRATFDLAFRGVTPDASIVALTKKQSEFSAPIWSYLENAVGGTRIQRGRDAAAENATVLAQVEARYGVPKEVVLGVWGMETNYGSFKGGKDVIRSLATLASIRYRGDFFRDELLIALELIEKGYAGRDELRLGGDGIALGLLQKKGPDDEGSRRRLKSRRRCLRRMVLRLGRDHVWRQHDSIELDGRTGRHGSDLSEPPGPHDLIAAPSQVPDRCAQDVDKPGEGENEK